MFPHVARLPALGLSLTCGLVLTEATGAPNRVPPASRTNAPPAPPNGTYTYALSRNGGSVGMTTVVIYRRDGTQEIETDEAGVAAAAHVHAIGSYRYADLGIQTYDGTYEAPFLRGSPLGRSDKYRAVPDFYAQTTVRFRARPGALAASVDGTPFADVLSVPAGTGVRAPWLFDAPFMTGALLLPAFRHRSNEALLAPVSEAFPSGVGTVAQRLVRAVPGSPKTPKSDLAVDVPGVARVWFDPATYIVHEVHFSGVNFDARLLSYVRGGFTAPFAPGAAPALAPAPPREAMTFTAADGTSLSGVLSRPEGDAATYPAVVFVAPGPGASSDYDGDGPTPMFPDLAAALVQRGYLVLRYDMRGVGKSGGSVASQTWESALGDAEAALTTLGQDAAVDPKRVYVLGFGNGADLALALAATAGASETRVAGAVALAPTVRGYRACPEAIETGTPAPRDAWRRSSLAHDPSVLAARVRTPLLVFHPGLPVCDETSDEVAAYDDRLRAANRLATIVAATDLTQRFGSRYEAEAPLDTQEFFPYRFDPSTAAAIGDWLDNPKTGSPGGLTGGLPASAPAKPPPPPPGVDRGGGGGLPRPAAGRSSAPAVQPGVVLPSGMTPPPIVTAPPTATPVPTPRPEATPAAATAAPASTSPAPSAAPATAAPATAAPTAAATP